MIQGPVLITGASKGIGRALAAALAAQGIPVIRTSRRPETIADPVPGVRYLTLDQEDDASVEACAAAAGPVEALVNNAGQSQIGAVEDVSMRRSRSFPDGFLRPHPADEGRPPGDEGTGPRDDHQHRLADGDVPPPYQSAYAAIKLGLEAFTKVLRQEVGRQGIKVSLVVRVTSETHIEPRTIAPAESVYATDLAAFRLARDKKMGKASPPEAAAAKIIKVMEMKNPGPVYYTGRLVPAMGFLKRLLPEKTAQKMIRGFYHLDG